MAWSTCYPCGFDIFWSTYNWYAIITFEKQVIDIVSFESTKLLWLIKMLSVVHPVSYTSSNDTVIDGDELGICDMDSICVGAIFWSKDHEIGSLDVGTFLKGNLYLGTVLDSKVFNHQIFAWVEQHSLHPMTTLIWLSSIIVNLCTNKNYSKVSQTTNKLILQMKMLNILLEHVCKAAGWKMWCTQN